jgi:hypothetical protein
VIDPLTFTILVALLPVVGATLLYVLAKGGRVKKRELYFIFGFISLTTFYIYASAPEVVYVEYATRGLYAPVIIFGLLGMIFLFVSMYFFKKHLEE